MSKTYDVNDFDGEGECGEFWCLENFGRALQVWQALNYSGGAPSVRLAATAFNCTPALIIAASESNYWLYLTGPRDNYDRLLIEADGE